MQTMHQGLNFC